MVGKHERKRLFVIDGKILLKWILKKWDGGMDWIGLA
jgi:hypothetical protein